MSRPTSANASDATRLNTSDALRARSTSGSDAAADAADEWTIAPKLDTSTDGDACTWYAEGICTRPRSCFDCLNVVIRGQKCTVSPLGECTNSYMIASDGGYPMANYTYCAADDAVCSACRAEWTRDYLTGTHVSTTARCTGDAGCICLAACELPDRDDRIVDDWCIPAVDGSNFRLVAGLVAGTIAFFVAATVLARRKLNRRLRRDTEHRDARNAARAALRGTRRPRASAHLPPLNLAGWAGMRETLVSTERLLLEGGSASSKPTLTRSSATLPSTDVEENDAYHLISPGRPPASQRTS
ncbi:unnamed protein product [Hyaloperonospora brassicae]|uniref:Uncharacterized protein n=1 Tax=Hyaloperonospora brassicae TaxID=162125 RepID=A0AAV0TGW3_HYABA|nr:unnamed protein product [Hyaloperonospora brassicae]